MTVYNAQDVTPELIISQFLYGSSTPPTDLESESLIRPAGAATSIQVDMASYFASAGRFAKASMSPLCGGHQFWKRYDHSNRRRD
jgi:hypothetical protein